MLKKINWGFIVAVMLMLSGYIFIVIRDNAMSKNNGSMITDVAYQMSASEQMSRMQISDSLPHYQYQKIADSLEQKISFDQQKKTMQPGWGFSLGFMGVRNTHRFAYDYVTNKQFSETGYYVSLPNYLTDETSSTELKDDKSYLRYVVWDSTQKKGHSELKEIPVRYLRDQKEVLLQLTETKFNTVKVIIIAVFIAFYLFMVYVTIGMPINIVLNIAKGKVFVLTNIKALFFIAFVLLGYFVFALLAPYIVSLLAGSKVPADFHLGFSGVFLDHLYYLLSGLAVLFIAFAFRKGYTLQKEQDLTI